MKPMLAEDWSEDKVQFPRIAQPKIDGCRALNIAGTLTGRSLKKFGNRFITSFFSHSSLIGFDGEMAAESCVHPDLCRLTTSALSSHKGEPYTLWHLFDYVTPDTRELPYRTRLSLLAARMDEVKRDFPAIGERLRLIPSFEVQTINQLNDLDSQWLDEGYEGSIIRDPEGKHKSGRSTVREGGLLRIKRFVDFEFRIDELIEGEENTNAATINALGHTERSTHQDGMVANGMVGAMLGTVLSVVKDGDKVLFEPGQQVRVGAGRLTHAERKHYFLLPNAILGRIGKGKLFPKGIKDKPRFPTFQSFRDPVDMGGE